MTTCGIVEVAAERDLRHQQVIPDQELDRPARVGRELEPVEHALRELDALLHVLGVAPLADVVEQQRERQQLGRVQLLENRVEALLARVGRIPERFHAADREQRVLVDRVLVVEVADDAPVDAGELREDAIEQPAVVHLGQARVEARARIEHAPHELTVAVGRHEVVGGVALDVLLDAGQRLLGYGAAVRERDAEQFKPERRPRRRAREIQEADALGRDLEMPADVARDAHPALRRGRAAHPLERTRRGARVPEVLPHQGFHALLRLPALAAEHFGHFFLQLVGHHVDVATALEVQNRADPLEEVLGVLQLPRGALELGVGTARLQEPDVARGRDVAQPARRALDVGLELVHRRVERLVPLVDELQQRIEQPPPVVGAEAPHPAVEPLKEPLVAGDEPHVEERQQEFGVPQVERRRLAEIGQLPDMLADRQPEIPERLEQRADEALVARPHRVLEEDEEVDVGVQAERLPAVSPEGHDRHGRTGVHARVFRQLLHQRVDASGVPGLDVPPSPPVPGGRDVFLPGITEHRARRRLVPFGA